MGRMIIQFLVTWLVPQITAATALLVVGSSGHSVLLICESYSLLLSKEVIGQPSDIPQCAEGALKN